MLAAWIAAGSTGVLAHPFRIALTWLALIVAVVLAWPWKHRQRLLLAGIVVLLALPILVPVTPMHELLVVAAVVAVLAAGQDGVRRTVLLVCAQAVLVLAIFRLACLSIPCVWLLSDAVGAGLGHCAGAVMGKPLSVGATYGGLDYLVLMGAFYALWLHATSGPRMARAVYAAVAVLAGHLLYLIVLSFSLDIADLLPETPEHTFDHPYVPPDWSWSAAVGQLLPWSVPAAAAIIHVMIAAVMLRWVSWRSEFDSQPEDAPSAPSSGEQTGWQRWARPGLLVLAALLPLSGTLSLGRCDLSGKTILASTQGRVDWYRPQHDSYGRDGAGMFGMLPILVQSLRGSFQVSTELSAEDLASADVLLLLHPTGPMPQERRERIHDFVRRGGSLLVAAEPFMRLGDETSNFNDVLESTGMFVRQDVAISKTGNWQHAYQLAAHPVSSGIDVRSSHAFTDSGVSIGVRWPARPVVVGRWGWSDPGSDAIMTNIYRLEAGERLGDLVLAAERSFGKGTLMVIGDSTSLTNEGSVRGYVLTGRLLSHLAGRIASPQSLWRRLLTLIMCAALLVLVVRRPKSQHIAWAAVLFAVSLAASGAIGRNSTRVVPDGRIVQKLSENAIKGLAYIDASHVVTHSDAEWSFNSINGLALTLMRNGYQTAMMPAITRERLDRAAVVVLLAPARQFSQTERTDLHHFVEGGGILICTVGAEEALPSQSLLADFGIRVPPSPVPTVGKWHEPEPMGHVRTFYLDANDYGAGDYKAGVIFHAAWPVEVEPGDRDMLAFGMKDQPVVGSRKIGKGRVVIIGDTGFAMNKNLEYIGGEAFEGQHENAHFWRWLFSRIVDGSEWIPPAPPENSETETEPP